MRVSVAMCTYQGSGYLREQLDSLAGQERRPDELVVVDDQSSDGTAEVVRSFAAGAPFPVRFEVNAKRLGVTGNFARAIGLCEGELIATCDQDDVWLPGKIAKLARVLEEDAKVGLAFCDLAIVDQGLADTGRTQWESLGVGRSLSGRMAGAGALRQLMRFNVVTGCAMMFRADLREAFLPMPADFIHDEWIAQVIAGLAEVRAVDEALVRYRQHASQQVGQAVHTLRGKVRYARERMQGEYFAKAVRRATALAERYERLGPRLRDGGLAGLARERERHWKWRESLGSRGRVARVGPVTGAWLRGEYDRFGYGWRSAAQDLALR